MGKLEGNVSNYIAFFIIINILFIMMISIVDGVILIFRVKNKKES